MNPTSSGTLFYHSSSPLIIPRVISVSDDGSTTSKTSALHVGATTTSPTKITPPPGLPQRASTTTTLFTEDDESQHDDLFKILSNPTCSECAQQQNMKTLNPCQKCGNLTCPGCALLGGCLSCSPKKSPRNPEGGIVAEIATTDEVVTTTDMTSLTTTATTKLTDGQIG